MKCVTNFVSGIKREGKGRHCNGALGGDPAGVSRGNSAAVATTNLESIFWFIVNRMVLCMKRVVIKIRKNALVV